MRFPSIHPWQLVVIGVILTIISAVLTNHVIEKNNNLIKEKKTQIRIIEQLISDNWQNSLALEEKKDTLVVLTQVTNMKDQILEDYLRQLLNQADAHHVEIPENIIRAYALAGKYVKDKRQKILDIIDNNYIEKIGIEKEISGLETNNSAYQNIALFLYILGLILVLSKDLARDR